MEAVAIRTDGYVGWLRDGLGPLGLAGIGVDEMERIMSNKPTRNSDASYMSSILWSSCILSAIQPTRGFFRWSDDLHKIFVEVVVYEGGPYGLVPRLSKAKPAAVKHTMEAIGVTGLTTRNIKSNLQKYRGKCDLGAESPSDVLGAPPRKAALNLPSENEIVMDNDSTMTEMEVVNNLLMDDTEMAEADFSAGNVQMMEKELMNEIQLIKQNHQYSQTAIDQYTCDLANYASHHAGSANSSSL